MIDKNEYLQEVLEGYVNLVRHPEDNDVILLNYTPLATYGLHWNDVTLNCRGLILNEKTNEVLARPFPKFFNYGEREEEIPKSNTEITIKQDGSLGICYRLNGKLKWATRGSFTSSQSQVCQRIWDYKYADVNVPDDLTLLVEIIHPETRVVVKYDFSDLVLIGAINRHTGYDYCHSELVDLATKLGMRVTEKVDGDLFSMVEKAKLLHYNEEGFVLRWKNGLRLKVKGQQYLEVHKAVYGLSDNQKLKFWEDGKINDLIYSVPEEFRTEIEELAERCDELAAKYECQAREYFVKAPKEIRKEFAIWVNSNVPENRHLVFKLMDNKMFDSDIRDVVVKKYKEVFLNE